MKTISIDLKDIVAFDILAYNAKTKKMREMWGGVAFLAAQGHKTLTFKDEDYDKVIESVNACDKLYSTELPNPTDLLRRLIKEKTG